MFLSCSNSKCDQNLIFTGYYVCIKRNDFVSKVSIGTPKGVLSVIKIQIPVGSSTMDAQVVFNASGNKLNYMAIKYFRAVSC